MGNSAQTLDQQIQFARHNFENHQALIRFSDAKAGAMITLFVFLAASGLQVVKDAALSTHLKPYSIGLLSALFVASGIGLFGSFLLCLWFVQEVLRPRGARYYEHPKPGTHLFWQDHVVAHRNSDAYFEAVKLATPDLLLRNLTDQIFELAHISQEKMTSLHAGRRACWFGFWCWVLAITSGLIILRLK